MKSFLRQGLFLSACATLLVNVSAQSTQMQPAYELYSWSTKSSAWEFSLLSLTSRNKTISEISDSKVIIRDLSSLKTRLAMLPKGTVVFWSNRIPGQGASDPTNALRLAYPPPIVVKEIQQHGESIGITLEILGRP